MQLDITGVEAAKNLGRPALVFNPCHDRWSPFPVTNVED